MADEGQGGAGGGLHDSGQPCRNKARRVAGLGGVQRVGADRDTGMANRHEPCLPELRRFYETYVEGA
ncbi:hypothetical protein GCM10009727_41070 [Actinomadura napierensis]|uniref:Uncharacterized protein n=1 Tax=Actinomadura napierensis TaxID=267854 RepID=A0ABN2ZIU9_9ACTN